MPRKLPLSNVNRKGLPKLPSVKPVGKQGTGQDPLKRFQKTVKQALKALELGKTYIADGAYFSGGESLIQAGVYFQRAANIASFFGLTKKKAKEFHG